jgi:hypothetical protein
MPLGYKYTNNTRNVVQLTSSSRVLMKVILLVKYNADLILKISVFWDVAPCSLEDVYRRFRGAYCLNHQNPDDGGIKHL